MVGGKTKPNRKGSAGVRSSVMGLMPRSSGGGNDGTHRRSLTMDAVLEMSNTTAADDDDDERGKRDSAMSNDSFRISSFDSFSTNPMMLSKNWKIVGRLMMIVIVKMEWKERLFIPQKV